MIHSFLLPFIGILMMLGAGFIGGFYEYAAAYDLAGSHPLTSEKKKRFFGKMLQISLIMGGLYLIVTYMDILLAALAYFYAEYGFPKIVKSRYEKFFAAAKEQASNHE